MVEWEALKENEEDVGEVKRREKVDGCLSIDTTSRAQGDRHSREGGRQVGGMEGGRKEGRGRGRKKDA